MKLHKKEVIQRKLRMMQQNGRHLQAMDVNQEEEHVCLNCGTEFVGKYCPNCGQKGNIDRLTFREAFENLLGIFTNFERGFLHTCIDLCYRPGHMIRDYLQGHRVEYVKPIQFIFTLGTIYLVEHYVIFQEWANKVQSNSTNDLVREDSTLRMIMDPIVEAMDNPTMLALLIVTCLILPNRFFFRKSPYGQYMNYAEHFYALVYISSQILLLSAILLPINAILGGHGISVGKWGIILTIFDLYQLMGFSVWKTVKQSIKSVIVGLISFVTVFILFSGVAVGIYYALYGVPEVFQKGKYREEPAVVSRPDSLRTDSVAAAEAGDTLRLTDIP